MALPAEINSAESGFRMAGDDGGGQCGPHTHNGVLFVLCHDRTNSTIEVWFDEGANRGEGFAEADSANHPSGLSSGSDDRKRPAWCIIGATAYVVYADASGNLEITPFNFEIKAWGAAITSSITHLTGSGTGPQGTALSIEPLPFGNLRVVHNSTLVSGRAAVYFVDVDMATGTFGTSTLLLSGSGVDYELRSTLSGAGGITHAFATKVGSSTGLIHISIAVDGTPGTEQVVTTSFGQQFGWDMGASYFSASAGVVKLAVPYVGLLASSPSRYPLWLATADSETNPTWSTEEVSDDPALDLFAVFTGTKISCGWISQKLHILFVGALQSTMPGADTDQDLYRVILDGGVMGSPTLVYGDSAEEIDHPRVRVIDNGLGIMFRQNVSSNGKPWYHEIAVDPCEGSGVPVANLVGAAY